jgi:uncharacterized protein (DUF1330 family)
MAGYWMVRGTAVLDQNAVEEYVKLWKPISEKYQAKMLASAGQHETVEGQDYPRNLLIEFPSYQTALDCYNDPDYTASLEYVRKAFKRELVIIEGN